MKSITEPGRDVPVLAETDVLVAGAGPAGIAAALGAARAGARTLLVERFGYVGGLCTGGLVIGIPPARGQAADNPAVLIEPPGKLGAITNEIQARLEARDAVANDQGGRFWAWWFPEAFKLLGLEMLEEAGVKLLFNVLSSEAILEEGALRGIVVETKGGPGAIMARVTIDCTGDADICARAGAPFVEGDGQRGTLPISLVLMVGGIDRDRYDAWREESRRRPAPVNAAGGQPALPPTVGRDFTHGMREFRLGEYMGMHGHVVDAYAADPWDLTRAENEAHRLAYERLDFIRRNIPGCEKAYISFTAPQLGVRESRLVQGEYIVRGDELQAGLILPDHIGFIKEGKSIPYRALVPLEIEGLLVAGRPISQDHSAVEATRTIPPCFVTGHAAGVAAAQAVAEDVPPRHIDVSRLQAKLKAAGEVFPPWM